MLKTFSIIVVFLIITSTNSYSQSLKEKDSLKILNVLEQQRIAWNDNNINKFMPVSYTHLTLPTSDLV